MTNMIIEPFSSFASTKRGRSDARAIDLHAFSLTAQAAQNSDQLKNAMLRAVRSVGVEFLQLTSYRRLQCSSVIWSELLDGAKSDGVTLFVSDAITKRAMTSGVPELWWCDGRGRPANDDRAWRNLLLCNGVRAGLTTAIHISDDCRYVFHFGATDDACFELGNAGLNVFSTLGFIASQRLAAWQVPPAGKASGSPLSARELEVIRWCKDGKSYPEIAQILGISTKTVEFHSANAMRKLGANQKISAIVEAVRRGLIEL